MRRIKIQLSRPDGTDALTPGMIDWSRYKKNPVILREHDWSSDPIGIFTDIDIKRCTGRPVFHCKTNESTSMAALYKKSKLAIFPGGELIRDEVGKAIAFKVYELSLAFKHPYHDRRNNTSDSAGDTSVPEGR